MEKGLIREVIAIMKVPESWDENDILALISDQQEETIRLDFKRADSLNPTEKNKKEISKDVSAFANSAGGVIVYGIQESPEQPHYATDLTPVDPNTCSKESLENVINSSIHPRVQGLLINPIDLKTRHSGKFVYVVVIPEGSTAHQASDKRYYKRFNFKSEPMEDYEVRQTMARASRPAYEAKLEAHQTGTTADTVKFRFHCIIQNQTEIAGHDVSAVLFVPKHLIDQSDEFAVEIAGVTYSRIPGAYVVSSSARETVVETASPFTPYAIQFQKSIVLRTGLPQGSAFRAIVKVYDQYGLALTASHDVTYPSCEIRCTGKLAGPMRLPGDATVEM